jgi:hypothetical protein
MRRMQAVAATAPGRHRIVRIRFRTVRRRRNVDLKVDYSSASYAVVAEAYEKGTRVSMKGKTTEEIIEDLF